MEGFGTRPFISGRGRPRSEHIPLNRRENRLLHFEPVLSFSSPDEYVRILREATQRDFDIQEAAINAFNKDNKFDCWPLFFKKSDPIFHYWVVVVHVGAAHMGAVSTEVFPEPGDRCAISLNNQATGPKPHNLEWLECCRIDNPADTFSLHAAKGYDGRFSWGAFATFQVAVPSTWGRRDPKPFDVLPLKPRGQDELPVVSLTPETKLSAYLRLRISETTKLVELKALGLAPGETSREAFHYLLRFDHPRHRTNLFDHYSHMRNPDAEGSQLSEVCRKWFSGLHADQRQTYNSLLRSLPCGVGFIHGASGTGKTHLALTIAAMSQAVRMAPNAAMKRPQVLFLMAKNRPLTDATNKMVEMYKQLGMNDMECMRVYNFNYEAKYSGDSFKKGSTSSGVNETHKAEFIDFEDVFQQTRPVYPPPVRIGRRTDCLAPTLREACEKFYIDHKYDDLANMSTHDGENYESMVPDARKNAWFDAVKGKLASTHFIATTPVAASKMASFAEGAFAPAIVIIDDASQVREASTLVALTSFNPKAVLLVGDTHQPGPWVSKLGQQNSYARQLQISAMERHWAKEVQTSLTVNHRALGNLHELCSGLWYGHMTSAFEAGERFPPSTLHLRLYLQRLTGAARIDVPRIIVHIMGAVTQEWNDGSKHNEIHREWVMKRVNELVHDHNFRSVDGKERGSILIMTPYRAATNFYRKAVNDLFRRLDREHRKTHGGDTGIHHDVRVDVRTIDSSQGSEADVAILDLVHQTETAHINSSKRMCVAMTRARQAEIVVMHHGMLFDAPWNGRRIPKTYGQLDASWVGRIYNHCNSRGQVFTVDKDAEAPVVAVRLPQEPSHAPRVHQQKMPANGGFDFQLRPTTRPSPPHSPGKDGCFTAARVHLPPSPRGE